MFITMPQLGETVTEGTIVHWYKSVGDEVVEDEAVFEVSTDKVDTEVPAAVSGVITEILVAEGETAPIGAQLAVVRTEGEVVAATSTPEPARPAVARPATRIDADLPPGARITRDDVAERLAARSRPLDRPALVAPARISAPAVGPVEGDHVEPFTAIRRRTGTHLRSSIDTAAHTLVVMQVDYARVEPVRDGARESFRAREGFGLTYLPFVARAAVDALA